MSLYFGTLVPPEEVQGGRGTLKNRETPGREARGMETETEQVKEGKTRLQRERVCKSKRERERKREREEGDV